MAQFTGSDLELAAGAVNPFGTGAGSGPAATISLNHGYTLYRRLYGRVGLGIGYRNYVVNDEEALIVDGEAQRFRRHLEFKEFGGRASAALGVALGKWSVELGLAYLRLLYLNSRITTATYHDNGQQISEPYTEVLPYRTMVPDKYEGSYHNRLHTNWLGHAALNRQLTPNLFVGLRYALHTRRPVFVHTNDFECDSSDPDDSCDRIPRFSRQIPARLGSVTLSVRYRFAKRRND